MIVSVINLKGGVGKTTSAMCLAEAARRRGVKSRVIDCDPQASASLWAYRAGEAGEELAFSVESGNLVTLKRLRHGQGVSFVDCPPTGNVTDEALRVADFVVVPTNPSEADLEKTINTMGALVSNEKLFGILLTRVNKSTLSYRAAKAELEAHEASVFETEIPQREDLKHKFGHALAGSLHGYEAAWVELCQAMGL